MIVMIYVVIFDDRVSYKADKLGGEEAEQLRPALSATLRHTHYKRQVIVFKGS